MMSGTLNDRIREWALGKPHSKAFVFLRNGEVESDSLTFGDLDRRVRAVAAALQGMGAGGERAVLLYPPSLDFVVGFLGCLYAGVIAVPAYPPGRDRSARRLLAIMEDARPAVIMSTTSLLGTVQKQLSDEAGFLPAHWLSTDDIEGGAESAARPTSPRPEDLAFLQYTSGSTGEPKGVMVTHGNITHNLEVIRTKFEESESTVGVGWLPLFHDMGLVGNVMEPVHLGIPCILMPPMAFLQRPSRWLHAITRYRGTTCGGPNFAYDMCVDRIPADEREGLDLTSWKVAFNGSEPIRAETLERFLDAFAPFGFRREAFYPCYGMAEVTLLVAGGARDEPPRLASVDAEALEQNRVEPAPADDPTPKRLVGCGRAGADHEIVIMDSRSRRPCPPGLVGEIWISGPSVARGYWNRPEETQDSFGARLADTGAGPYLRTGDLGFFHDGHLFVTGRLKDLIIVRGQNYYPQDIERTAEESHPALRPGNGAAFLVDADGSDHLVVVQEVQRTWLRRLDVGEVAGNIRGAVAEEHGLQVSALVLAMPGSVPRTSSGKIRRRACKAALIAGHLAEVARQVNGPLRAKLHAGEGGTHLARPDTLCDMLGSSNPTQESR
jgi:acyl-CoA synthetase (AMP-forming)/AMP-acid ligase II